MGKFLSELDPNQVELNHSTFLSILKNEDLSVLRRPRPCLFLATVPQPRTPARIGMRLERDKLDSRFLILSQAKKKQSAGRKAMCDQVYDQGSDGAR